MSVETSLGATAESGAGRLRDDRLKQGCQRAIHQAFAWRYTAAVATVPLLGLLICIAATRTDILSPQTIRPNVVMAGIFNVIGVRLTTAELLPLVVATLVAYLFAVRVSDRVSARTVIASVVVLNVAAILAPPLFSTDPFSYQAYARMLVIYHTNPYTHGPNAISLDPIYPYIGAQWIGTPTVYGPLFTLLTAPLAWASIALSDITFKVIAGLCCAGTLRLVWKAAPLRGVNPVRAIALFGLNPVIMLSCVGGGHNDSLMTWLMMLGVYAALTARDRGAGALITVSAAIKLSGGVILPFALLSHVGANPAARRKRLLIGTAAVAVPILVVSDLLFGTGVLKIFGTLESSQSKGAWQSVPGFFFVVTSEHVTRLARDVVNVLLVGILANLLWRVWTQRLDWIEGAAWATVAVLVTAWTMLPWYLTWLMPLAAICKGDRIWRAAIVMTALTGAVMVGNCVPQGIPWLGT